MSDPIADAAANMNAPSSTEPGILTEIVDEFKALGEKIDHVIHPNAEAGTAAPGESLSGSSTTEGDVAGSAQTDQSTRTNSPNTLIAHTEISPSSDADAPAVVQPGETAAASAEAAHVDTSATTSANTVGSGETQAAADLPNADAGVATVLSEASPAAITGATSVSSSIEGDVPNAADTPRVGIVTAASIGDSIRSHLAAIKNHLSIRGFEQSAVADIHAELDKIEGLL